MTLSLASGLAAFSFYITACTLLFLQYRKPSTYSRNLIIFPGTLAVIFHAVFLWQHLITEQGFQLGLFPVASAIALCGTTVVLLSVLYRPFEWLSAFTFPFAAASLPAVHWLESDLGARSLSYGLGLHVMLSIVAYSVLALSAGQALLLWFQNRQLKSGHIQGVMRVFPPVQVMETLLFETIWLGEILLTLAIINGALYVESLFAQHLVHKTVLTLIAWVVFAVLLAGRHLKGWRGRTAIRFTLSGFGVLLVGFFGSQIVLEFILKR